MVAPVTTKLIKGINRAKTSAWMPEGVWFDFFEGTVYQGGRKLNLYRPLETIPVFAKAGAIVPMTEQISAKEAESNPSQLTVRVYAGATNAFVLYEDDNVSREYENDDCVKTPMKLTWSEKKSFTIGPAEGNRELIPQRRDYCIELYGSTAGEAQVTVNGVKVTVSADKDKNAAKLIVMVTGIKAEDTVEVIFPDSSEIAENPVMEQVFRLLDLAEMDYRMKEGLYRLLQKHQKHLAALVSELETMEMEEALRGAILELVTAY